MNPVFVASTFIAFHIPNRVVFGYIEAEFYVDSIVLFVYTTDAYVHNIQIIHACNRTCSVTQCVLLW